MPSSSDPALRTPAGRLEAAREGAVLVLRIANEARANALDPGILDALLAALQGEPADGARALVLTGSGTRVFSSGFDLAEIAAERRTEAMEDAERRVLEVAAAIERHPRPVVCALNGGAYGAGLQLAMSCDWRIARRGARFAMPPARLGLVYAPEGLRAFVDAVGSGHARELFLTGRPIDAERALRIGLVNDLVEGEEVEPRALEAARAAASCAPLALAGTKAFLRAIAGAEAEAEASARDLRRRAFASEDLAEGLAAFHEKREPRFRGR
jgi:enoyl-CoA hydratase/carnithine racemase